MDDREMLELAAKAAGIEQGAERTECGISTTLPDGRHGHLPRWNPLADDGDALRLAIDLGLDICIHDRASVNSGRWSAELDVHWLSPIQFGNDPYAAARRAIVLAAAAIAQADEQEAPR